VGYLERGSCLLASPPGVGAPLLELYASAARPRDKAGAGQAARIRGGARAAALGGVWQLGAAGCCKRRGTRSCARVQPRAWQRTLPWGSSGVAVPVLWSCTFAALCSAQQGCTQNWPLPRRDEDEWQAGVQRPVVRAARATGRGLDRALAAWARSPIPDLTLSVERGSNHS
jgi:hypothetical protein